MNTCLKLLLSFTWPSHGTSEVITWTMIKMEDHEKNWNLAICDSRFRVLAPERCLNQSSQLGALRMSRVQALQYYFTYCLSLWKAPRWTRTSISNLFMKEEYMNSCLKLLIQLRSLISFTSTSHGTSHTQWPEWKAMKNFWTFTVAMCHSRFRVLAPARCIHRFLKEIMAF